MITAVLPIVALIALLSVCKLPAWKAALGALVLGVGLAALRGLTLSNLLSAALEGVKTGLYPIGLVIVGALFVYGVVVASGRLEDIKTGLASLAPDKGFAALLIVWGFGNFMEGMAGFGTAVAIPCAILVGIGFDPFKAVLCCLVANTTPTAFGSVGVPTMVLASEAGVDLVDLTRQAAWLQLGVTALGPFLILFIVGGLAEVRRHARLALVVDAAFLLPYLAVALTLGCELPDIFGGLAVMVSMLGLGNRANFRMREQAFAWAPFGCVVIVLCAASFLPASIKPAPGGFLILAGFLGALILRVPFLRTVRLVFETVWQYRLALLTVCTILALAKVMGRAGMIQDLANTLVSVTGSAYAFFAPVVGGLGGFVTGSGTSTCVLFGKLQASVGAESGRSLLYAAANVMGAGIGKMICPQSIVLGCAAAGIAGRESEILVKAGYYFLPILLLAGLICDIISKI